MSFAPAIEDPANLRKSRSIGAWLGLTPKRYQSGEVDSEGHISRRRYPRGRTSQARKALHNGPIRRPHHPARTIAPAMR
jgi:transposase